MRTSWDAIRRNVSVLSSQVGKDMLIWFRRPVMIAATISPSVAYMFITFFISFTIGRNPVALVLDGNGPEASRLASVIQHSDEFISHRMTQSQAQTALHNMSVEAIITIPADFDSTLQLHLPTRVQMTVNNVNADESDDLRRSLPTAITDFYKSSPNNPLPIGMTETDLHAKDFTLGQFEFIPILIFVIMISGIISGGFMASQEWENGSISELLLAPTGRWLIVLAKVLSGWIMTTTLACVALLVGAFARFIAVPNAAVLPSALMLLLTCLASAAIGTSLGLTFRYIGKVQAIGVQIAMNAFFFSGGISVVAFLPVIFQKASRFVPTYYAVHALDREILYQSSTGVIRDFLVIGLLALAAISWTVVAFRRQALA